VESGWIYKPTPESDDMVTCTYCDLGLDGWEPADDPLYATKSSFPFCSTNWVSSDQHYKRNPECTFFTLINTSTEKPALKKKAAAKGRKPRASKASRLSTQSALTVTSEGHSLTDMPAEEDDSVLTTATNATVSQGAKKMPKVAKKAAVRKTKGKKDEPVEVFAPEPEDVDSDIKVEQKPKATKGRKRNSDEMEDITIPELVLAPPAKRRATRTKGSMAVADSVVMSATIAADDINSEELSVETAPALRKRGRPSKATRTASTASKASLRAHIPDEDEIDDALLADLDRPLTDDEEMSEVLVVVPKKNRVSQVGKGASAAPMRKTSRTSKITKIDHHAMFGTEEMEIDEAAIEAELEAIQIEAMQAEESKPLPKAKAAKGKQPRKPSAKQQAAAKRAAEAAEVEAQVQVQLEASNSNHEEVSNTVEPAHEPSPVPQPKAKRGGSRAPAQKAGRGTRGSVMSVAESNISVVSEAEGPQDDSGNETDASMASQSTVVRGGGRRGSTLKKGRVGKKAAPRNIEEIVRKPLLPPPVEHETAEEAKTKAISSKKTVQQEVFDVVEEVVMVVEPVEAPAPKATKAKLAKGKGKAKATPELAEPVEQAPSPAPRSPTPPPKEATPSFSPQSSDAENRPPSSKPSTIKNTHTASRVPLAAGTPMMSPSKRNVIAGLKSTHPWSAVDLDDVFMKSPQIDKENARLVGAGLLNDAVDKAKKGQLTSPEKSMTVEDWIRFNAGLAEEKLRGECERLVGAFESQGTKAMVALEGIECVDR
jgi:hypothetical protein